MGRNETLASFDGMYPVLVSVRSLSFLMDNGTGCLSTLPDASEVLLDSGERWCGNLITYEFL